LIYSSSTATNTPLAANLAAGELAINTADGILFYKDSSNVVQKIGYKLTPTTAGGTGLTSFTANGVVYASSTSALATGSALTFDGTNLGLGVTPSTWTNLKVLETGYSSSFGGNIASSVTYVVSNGIFNGAWLYKTTGPASYYRVDGSTGAHVWFNAPSGTAGTAITFTQAMTLNSSGNLGLGVTPSAWNSATKAMQISTAATFWGLNNNQAYVGSNSFYDAAGNFKYIVTDNATQYRQWQGAHAWFTAASGTAGNAITFTQAMTLDASGNLLVGTTSSTDSTGIGFKVRPSASGTAVTATHNTSGGVSTYHVYNINATNNGYRFYVNIDGGISNYSANNVNLSDRREKTNFAPASSYLDKICAIPVQTFNYIDQNMEDDGGLTLGVVAQDVQAVAPEMVMESNWGTEEEPKMRLSIYQTDLQYALMKCIQEQQALITQLTARITALEGA
jgi:hypothetical protein